MKLDSLAKPARITMLAAALALPAGLTLAQNEAPQTPQTTEQTQQERLRNIKEWDVKSGKPAIDGYDPVAYFPEGGGKPTKGDKKFEYTYKGVLYRFASQKNLDLFKQAPDRYEPAHGGWCSWAIRTGDKTEINPKTFIVKNDRLYLFYNGLLGNTKKDWEKGNHDTLLAEADGAWKKISSEEPHSAPAPGGE
jgi:YHS domain-containing protein